MTLLNYLEQHIRKEGEGWWLIQKAPYCVLPQHIPCGVLSPRTAPAPGRYSVNKTKPSRAMGSQI